MTAPDPQALTTTDARLAAARRRRDEILAREDMLDDEAVRQALNVAPRDLRHAGQILAVWDGVRYLYPALQIDRGTGQLRPGLAELLALIPIERSGWRAALWLYQPHGRLAGRAPFEVFPSDPTAVIAVARSTFQPGEANW